MSDSNITPMMGIAITGGVVAVLSKVGVKVIDKCGIGVININLCTIQNTDENGVFKYVMKYFITHSNRLEIPRAQSVIYKRK